MLEGEMHQAAGYEDVVPKVTEPTRRASTKAMNFSAWAATRRALESLDREFFLG
jgi:hypothetical protein